MTLWILLSTLLAAAAAALTIPLVRRFDAKRDPDSLTILMQQLDDIDAQERSGGLAPADAEPLRTEIKRRILAEGRVAGRPALPLSSNVRTGLAITLAAILGVGVTGLYSKLGRPELGGTVTADAAAIADPATGDQPAPDVSAMVSSLEQRMQAEPNDPEGWRMLGWSYFQLQRFADSAKAYGKALALSPKEAVYASAMGEALVQAAQGNVTPDAATAFETARRLDPADARSRYFLALQKEQRGDAKGAINDWIALLAEAPADAPFAPQLRQIIVDSAKAAGMDVSRRLPKIPAAPVPPMAGVAPGPTADDVAAASRMDPNDRQAMVRGMVDGLAAKLAANPRDADGWARLIRARMVLGETDKAAAAYRDAAKAFAGDAATLNSLAATAKQLGVPGV